VGEAAPGIGDGDGVEGGSGGGHETGEGALARAAQALLDFGEGQLDGVEIGRIAGQEVQLATGALDQGARPRALVHGEVVEDDELPGHQAGQQALLNEGLERLPIDGAIKDHGRPHPGGGDAGQQGHALPASAWHRTDGPLPTRRPCPQPTQAGGGGRLIEKDEALRSDRGQLLPPLLPGGLVTLGGDQRLFLSGKPSRAKARDMVAVLTR
jgi:hypothetical protein